MNQMQDRSNLFAGHDSNRNRRLLIPSLYQPVADPIETINTMKKIGPERCIIGSDFGHVLHMDSIDGMRVFIRALLAFGIKEKRSRSCFATTRQN